MTFTSFHYLLFLAAAYLTFSFSVIPGGGRFRWVVLLIVSYWFYGTLDAIHLPLLLALVTIISYSCGLLLGSADNPARRKLIYWSGVMTCVLILAAMKYLPTMLAGFTIHVSRFTFHLPPLTLNPSLLLSIGVSYFTFQAISYLTDVHLEIEKPERHFGWFAVYLAFFPKLLQGPIERSGDLLPQLREPYAFSPENVRSGLLLFTWGLFKKVVLADRLALYVNPVYDHVHDHSGVVLIAATYLYALQIYFDFSGYTDMALGSARLFNIRLTQNFNSPYLATSLADFWRRWHMSFSRWLLDYLFKPLQMQWRTWGSRGAAAALVVTFLVSGIWHGSRWGFVVWGLLHGCYLAASVAYRPLQKRLHKRFGLEKTLTLKVWQTFCVFNLVCLAWIFFRANSIGDACFIVIHLFDGFTGLRGFVTSNGSYDLSLLVIFLAAAMLVTFSARYGRLGNIFNGNWLVRLSCYYALVMSIILFGATQSDTFIYAQF